MNREEKADFFDRMGRMFENYMKTRNSFEEKLTNELCQYITENHPDKKGVEIPDALKESARSYAWIAYEVLGDAIKAQEKGEPYNFKRTCSILKSDEEIEKQIDKILPDFPEEKWETIRKGIWDEYKKSRVYELFQKGIHDKIKEVLVEFFEDSILELEGEYLQQLEDDTYLLVAWHFIQDMNKYLKNR
ncbi:MAG: hypothetical protein V5A59_14070 [Bacteroidales bacterium]